RRRRPARAAPDTTIPPAPPRRPRCSFPRCAPARSPAPATDCGHRPLRATAPAPRRARVRTETRPAARRAPARPARTRPARSSRPALRFAQGPSGLLTYHRALRGVAHLGIPRRRRLPAQHGFLHGGQHHTLGDPHRETRERLAEKREHVRRETA